MKKKMTNDYFNFANQIPSKPPRVSTRRDYNREYWEICLFLGEVVEIFFKDEKVATVLASRNFSEVGVFKVKANEPFLTIRREAEETEEGVKLGPGYGGADHIQFGLHYVEMEDARKLKPIEIPQARWDEELDGYWFKLPPEIKLRRK